jgi:hypothetical protein
MAIEYTISNKDDFLEVKAAGRGNDLSEVQKYVRAVIEALQKTKRKCVLCDEIALTHEL